LFLTNCALDRLGESLYIYLPVSICAGVPIGWYYVAKIADVEEIGANWLHTGPAGAKRSASRRTCREFRSA